MTGAEIAAITAGAKIAGTAANLAQQKPPTPAMRGRGVQKAAIPSAGPQPLPTQPNLLPAPQLPSAGGDDDLMKLLKGLAG